MTIERVRVPLGVVGVIYESRPNVTADAGALCLKAGNAVILRGGSDSHRSSRAIHAALVAGLREAGLPEDAIQLVPTRDRAAVGLMLRGLDGSIDVIVPRGGKSLVARVQSEARVPVFAHLEGVCHVYVDKAADLDMAKTHRAQRQDAAHRRLRRGRDAAGRSRRGRQRISKPLVTMLIDAGCEVRGDEAVREADARVKPATEEDWSTEYLDAIIAAKVVDGVDGAIAHIERYGSHHTDAIVTADGRRRRNSWRRSIPRSCCTTPRRNSPTAANSASAPRSASPPASCMRAARSASSSSPLQVSRARHRGRRGREGTAADARQKRHRTARRAAAACRRHADRPVRRLVRSAA